MSRRILRCDGLPIMSLIVVTPFASITPNSSPAIESGTSSSQNRCVCISARPGMRNLPRPSITRAPAGTATLPVEPTSTIRPSRTRTVESLRMVSECIGTTDTPVTAKVPGVNAPARAERPLVAPQRCSQAHKR